MNWKFLLILVNFDGWACKGHISIWSVNADEFLVKMSLIFWWCISEPLILAPWVKSSGITAVLICDLVKWKQKGMYDDYTI